MRWRKIAWLAKKRTTSLKGGASGDGAGGRGSAGAALLIPRGGSGTVKRTNRARAMPGRPTMRKAARHPKNSFTQPPTRKPRRMPQFTPVPKIAMAVARRSGG